MAEDTPRTETPEVEPNDDAKAKKIAAAKAKAAAAKAAKAEGGKADGPKDPWLEKPVAPSHEDAIEHPEVSAINDALDGAVLAADHFAGELTITIAPDRVTEVCTFLKEQRQYHFLVDLTAVDWPEREGGRFDVVYWLHRFEDEQRLRLLATVPGDDQPIASVSPIWRTANWMEREAYDMYGIVFEGHPNLERILTWESFNGHPLRKDFPVEGIDTGAAIYNEVYPPGGGPQTEEEEGQEK